MRGTVIGNWIAATFPNELCALKPEDMPAQSHWESAHTRICTGKCEADATARWRAACEADENAVPEELPRLGEDVWTCPTCGGETRGSGDGKTIDDGRGFYGLRFYDPAGDWRKGILQHATKTHTQPTIDGACGESSVLNILNAIGLNLHKVHSTSKLDIYTITEYVK
jgi:hypothetical protein